MARLTTIPSMASPASNVRPVISRLTAIGAIALGIAGAIAGLWIGLVTNPRTAWFALFELGAPASILGALVGFICGAIALVVRRRHRPT
jgi:hypothetical protein